ncbi:hypothetical protein amrb99_37120 [Actinomadura sp. RB99]|nr:hypothetical protein [Actinomadura sp. RB99]
MTTGKRSGPPPDTESRPQKSSTRTTTSVADMPVPVVAYQPDARRTRWLVVLEVCPRCQRPHQFYGTRTAPPRVRSCCGRTYHLFPIFGGNSEPPEGAA